MTARRVDTQVQRGRHVVSVLGKNKERANPDSMSVESQETHVDHRSLHNSRWKAFNSIREIAIFFVEFDGQPVSELLIEPRLRTKARQLTACEYPLLVLPVVANGI